MKNCFLRKAMGYPITVIPVKQFFYLRQVIRLSGTRFLRSFSAVSIPAVHLRIAEHVKTKLMSFP